MYLIVHEDKTFRIVSDWKNHQSEKPFKIISGIASEKGHTIAEKKGDKKAKAKAK